MVVHSSQGIKDAGRAFLVRGGRDWLRARGAYTLVGYALLLLGEFTCIHSPTIFSQADPSVREQFDLFVIILLAAEFVVFVLGACLWRVLAQGVRRVFIGLACLLVALGLIGVFALEVLGGMAGSVGADAVGGAAANATAGMGALWPLLGLAAVGLGLGFALFNLAWAHVFSALKLQELYRWVIFSHLLGLLLYLALTCMPTVAVVPLILVASLGSAILLSLSVPSREGERTEERPPAAAAKQAARLLGRPVLCTAAFGFMSGLVSQVSAQGRLPLESFQQMSILASLIVVGILLLPTLLLSKPLNITTAYGIALPIAAAGFLLLPFVWDSLFGLTNALVNMGLMTVSIILWCMLATTTAQTRLPVPVVFGSCLAVVVGVRLLGKVLGFVHESSLTQSFLSLAAVALVSIYLLSMVSLLFLRGQRLSGARRQQAEGADPRIVVWGEDRYRECCEQIAASADFTPREQEILLLLGQGRSVANIAHSLFVSENTAKSHIRSIYRKLDVHSKQELIDHISNALEE